MRGAYRDAQRATRLDEASQPGSAYPRRVCDDDAPFDEPVVIAIEESIDLHRFLPSETRDVVEAYLEAALERGFREVRIIHGRGRGVQRAQVRRVLEGHPGVLRFADAPGERGGWGATLVWLRRGDEPDAPT